MKLFILLGTLAVLWCSVQAEDDVEREKIIANLIKSSGFDGDAQKIRDAIANEKLADVDNEAGRLERDELADKITFHLSTRWNLFDIQQIWIGDTAGLAATPFDPRRETRIITHGWRQSGDSLSATLIRDAYLINGDYNVVVIDWSALQGDSLTLPPLMARRVAAYVALFINYIEAQGADLSKTIMVGHSLGAHVIGIAALRASGTVGYVVGLDPAGSFFTDSSSGWRIDKGDASYVQVIHTDNSYFGLGEAVGDVDFYPNGGNDQPSCITDITGVCSHMRAWMYFSESINNGVGFWSTQCGSWQAFQGNSCIGNARALMGGAFPTTTAKGTFFLRTNGLPPYALGA